MPKNVVGNIQVLFSETCLQAPAAIERIQESLPKRGSVKFLLIALLSLAGVYSGGSAQSSNYKPTLTTLEKQSLAAGEIIMREVESEHDQGQTIETIGLINASGELLLHILTDYTAYPEFMSAVDQVEIIDQTGVEATLNYILSPVLGFTKKYRIKIAPLQLEEEVWKIEWHFMEWPGLKPRETIGDTQGYWLIIEQAPHRSLVQYYVYSDPGPVPFGLGGLVDILSRDSIKDVFTETRDRAEKMIQLIDQ